MTKILIVGSGGREHALAWRCRHEGHEVLVTPGSEGLSAVVATFGEGVLAANGELDRRKLKQLRNIAYGTEDSLEEVPFASRELSKPVFEHYICEADGVK